MSAFPAVVGPVLLILAHERGAAFTARAANGTLLGLVALAGFLFAYSAMARYAGWVISLIAGWACAGAIAASISLWGQALAFPGGLIAATIALALAYRAMPETVAPQPVPRSARRDITFRMTATAALVLALSGAAELVGPLIGGVLTALPILASVLAVFTHRDQGAKAVVALLRGMVTGMAGFAGFCAVVALLVVPLGVIPAFTTATLAAVALAGVAMFSHQVDAPSGASASRT